MAQTGRRSFQAGPRLPIGNAGLERMSIDEAGFLSPEIEGYIQKHRAENPGWFQIAEQLNLLAQRQLLSFSVPDHDRGTVISTLLFMRGLSNFQGAILLAERGMSSEAVF
jgi:hypothetical protein